MNAIRIQPVNILNATATYFSVDSVTIRQLTTPDGSGEAIIFCALRTDQLQSIHSQPVSLTDTDYNEWGNDDEFIINFALTRLGLTRDTTT